MNGMVILGKLQKTFSFVRLALNVMYFFKLNKPSQILIFFPFVDGKTLGKLIFVLVFPRGFFPNRTQLRPFRTSLGQFRLNGRLRTEFNCPQ